jgi:hypothetical protein
MTMSGRDLYRILDHLPFPRLDPDFEFPIFSNNRTANPTSSSLTSYQPTHSPQPMNKTLSAPPISAAGHNPIQRAHERPNGVRQIADHDLHRGGPAPLRCSGARVPQKNGSNLNQPNYNISARVRPSLPSDPKV